MKNDDLQKHLAKLLTVNCVRNSKLEDLHSGIVPYTETGDYSDVYVITPKGKIPWNELSRFNNAEMKELMIQIVDKVYTYLTVMDMDNPDYDGKRSDFIDRLTRYYPNDWDEPKIDKNLLPD